MDLEFVGLVFMGPQQEVRGRWPDPNSGGSGPWLLPLHPDGPRQRGLIPESVKLELGLGLSF